MRCEIQFLVYELVDARSLDFVVGELTCRLVVYVNCCSKLFSEHFMSSL